MDVLGELAQRRMSKGKKALVNMPTSSVDRSLGALRIRTCTWNVGNAVPPKDMSSWLAPDEGNHIIVVGAQESTYGATSKVDAVYNMAAIIQETANDKRASVVSQAANIIKLPTTSSHDDNAKTHVFKSMYFHRPRTCLACGKTMAMTNGACCTQCKKCAHRTCVDAVPAACDAMLGSALSPRPSTNSADPQEVDVDGGEDAGLDWLVTVQRHLPTYKLIETTTMMEIRIAVFGSDELLSKYNVHNIHKGSEATGIGRVVGNKGGAAVSFKVGGKVLAFVAAHLAAHEGTKYLQTRNDDVREIIRNLSAHPDIHLHHVVDHLFWIGDLNYRIDLGLNNPAADAMTHEKKWENVHDMVARRDITALLAQDELRHEMQTGAVFSDFQEAEITFCPTFKVERTPGLTYKKQRVPSYCDRVLWHSLPALRDRVTCLEYSAVPEIPTSDHKPVYATFKLDLHDDMPEMSCADESLRGAVLKMTTIEIDFTDNTEVVAEREGNEETEARIMTGDVGAIEDHMVALDKRLEDLDAETAECGLLKREYDLLKKELELVNLEDRLLERLAEAKAVLRSETGDAPSAVPKRRESYVPKPDRSVHLGFIADRFSNLDGRSMKQRMSTADNKLTFAPEDLVPLTCIADVTATQLYDKHFVLTLFKNKRKGMGAVHIGQCAIPFRDFLTSGHGVEVQFTATITKYSSKRGYVCGSGVLLLPQPYE